MAEEPPEGTPITSVQLEQILKRAKSDAAFRDAFVNTPAEALRSLGLRADPEWVVFFHRLKAANFDTAIQHKLENDPIGEGEGESQESGLNASTHGAGDDPMQ